VETDLVGDKMGRIHVGRQDLDELQTRKMKGLKRSRDAADDDQADDESMSEVEDKDHEDEKVIFISRSEDSEDDSIRSGGAEAKRPRVT
jgi:Sec-independent protein translocase protein TatA